MFKKNMNFTTFNYQSSDFFIFRLLLNLFYIQYFNMKVAISYKLYLIFFYLLNASNVDFVNMEENYFNMQQNCINVQHLYFDCMQYINVIQIIFKIKIF